MAGPRIMAWSPNPAQTTIKCEVRLVYFALGRVYSDGGSGESTDTEQLVGATPKNLKGVIPEGRTSSTARNRKEARRGVAAVVAQRMGRKVRPPSSRNHPGLFVFCARPELAS